MRESGRMPDLFSLFNVTLNSFQGLPELDSGLKQVQHDSVDLLEKVSSPLL